VNISGPTHFAQCHVSGEVGREAANSVSLRRRLRPGAPSFLSGWPARSSKQPLSAPTRLLSAVHQERRRAERLAGVLRAGLPREARVPGPSAPAACWLACL
jgi:hypothetical protein